MILFTCLTFDFVDGDNTIRAHDCAGGAADAVVIDGLGIVITLAVHILRKLDAVHWACLKAHTTAFATFDVNVDLSFKCHSISFIRLIFTIGLLS